MNNEQELYDTLRWFMGEHDLRWQATIGNTDNISVPCLLEGQYVSAKRVEDVTLDAFRLFQPFGLRVRVDKDSTILDPAAEHSMWIVRIYLEKEEGQAAL